MVILIFFLVMLMILGFLFHVVAAFGREKERQNRILEEELFRRQLLLENQFNEKKNNVGIHKDSNRQLPKRKSPTQFSSLVQSQM